MRVPIVVGNWKMFKTLAEARALAEAVRHALEGVPASAVEVGLGPSFPLLAAVGEAIAGGPLFLSAQDCHEKPEGAFTGAVSCAQIASCGATTVILGHSERRHVFGETDALVNAKVRAALSAGLRPILCVGETEAERLSGRTFEVVSRQISLGLEGVTEAQAARLVLAYEPVWAIGTGRNATPEQAQEVHALARGALGKRFSPAFAERARIQYGGSVKPANAASILAMPDVDGALVGGASLVAADFAAIVRAAAQAAQGKGKHGS